MQNQEIATRLKNLPIVDIVDRSVRLGISEGVALISNRIFEDNTDINGSGFGAYSTSYKKVREAKGRQTSVVDLQFNKDLLRSIGDEFTENKYSIKIKEDLNIKKARGFEKNRGIEVFFSSQEELDKIVGEIEKEFIRQVEDEF